MRVDANGVIIDHVRQEIESEHIGGDITQTDYVWMELKPERRLYRCQLDAAQCDYRFEVWQPTANVNKAHIYRWQIDVWNNCNAGHSDTMLNGDKAQTQIWNRAASATLTHTGMYRMWMIKDSTGAWHGEYTIRSQEIKVTGYFTLPPNATWLGILCVPATGATKWRNRNVEWS